MGLFSRSLLRFSASEPKWLLNLLAIQITVGGELLLGGAYSDSVFKANSDFYDL